MQIPHWKYSLPFLNDANREKNTVFTENLHLIAWKYGYNPVIGIKNATSRTFQSFTQNFVVFIYKKSTFLRQTLQNVIFFSLHIKIPTNSYTHDRKRN